MPSNEESLLGYFTELLPPCKSSKTSHKEGKGEIRVRPIKGKEIVCFFIIDNDGARQALQIQGNDPSERKRVICDCLIFWGRKTQAGKVSDEAFCLVELKGSDLKHAMKQILNTHDHLWKLLESSPRKNKLQTITKKPISISMAPPPKRAKIKILWPSEKNWSQGLMATLLTVAIAISGHFFANNLSRTKAPGV